MLIEFSLMLKTNEIISCFSLSIFLYQQNIFEVHPSQATQFILKEWSGVKSDLPFFPLMRLFQYIEE